MTPLETVGVSVLTSGFVVLTTLVTQHRLRRSKNREEERAHLRHLYGLWIGAFTTSGRAIRLLKTIKNTEAKQGFAREYYQASELVTKLTWELCLLEQDGSRRQRVLAAHLAFTEDDERGAILASQLLEELSKSGELREQR